VRPARVPRRARAAPARTDSGTACVCPCAPRHLGSRRVASRVASPSHGVSVCVVCACRCHACPVGCRGPWVRRAGRGVGDGRVAARGAARRETPLSQTLELRETLSRLATHGHKQRTKRSATVRSLVARGQGLPGLPARVRPAERPAVLTISFFFLLTCLLLYLSRYSDLRRLSL